MPVGSVQISQETRQGRSNTGRYNVLQTWGPVTGIWVYQGYSHKDAMAAAAEAIAHAHSTPEGANARLYNHLSENTASRKTADVPGAIGVVYSPEGEMLYVTEDGGLSPDRAQAANFGFFDSAEQAAYSIAARRWGHENKGPMGSVGGDGTWNSYAKNNTNVWYTDEGKVTLSQRQAADTGDGWADGYSDGFDRASNKPGAVDRREEWDFEPQTEYQHEYQRAFSEGVRAGVNERYPGYDNPHSSPPDWFDPADAGETW